MVEIDKELLKGIIDILILSLIKSNDDIYGYNIMKIVNAEAKDIFSLQTGTLYIALKRIENQGYIKSYIKETSNEIKRRHYSITTEGISHLAKLYDDLDKINNLVLSIKNGGV